MGPLRSLTTGTRSRLDTAPVLPIGQRGAGGRVVSLHPTSRKNQPDQDTNCYRVGRSILPNGYLAGAIGRAGAFGVTAAMNELISFGEVRRPGPP
jgi:hypothetical protein